MVTTAGQDGKRRSGRVSTERLHYFNEPLCGRQVSFYSDISSSSEASAGELNATAAALEAFLAPTVETQLFSTHPRNNVDHGMAELSKQMQLWTDEALSRRSSFPSVAHAAPQSGPGQVAQSRAHSSVAGQAVAAQSGPAGAAADSRGLVIKLSPMSSQTSLLSSSSFSSNFRSPTASFLSTESSRTAGPIELVEIPASPSSAQPKPFTRVIIKKREGSMRSGDQVSSYDAASFRSSEETDSDNGDPANAGPPLEAGPAGTHGRNSISRTLRRLWQVSAQSIRRVGKVANPKARAA
eukprot:CAMPEP_0198333432 /NCGR_PEP_ID=MMETSP1450-20131203/18946_1 /TAXON_ID=753684 ORGANISM="Madagascaria erythrocladiodes, Strain CCMP3234" /NCGR_SAMPLE_ID=MMETSP1450 /ASSEMBLY_ACC=CAM_ASM_001115 /LENGTH=295 /DNA_ID=CAMNT_0044037947 /DNA_START=241 /DNA_END=1128 /DNA_ORIENTATION=+